MREIYSEDIIMAEEQKITNVTTVGEENNKQKKDGIYKYILIILRYLLILLLLSIFIITITILTVRTLQDQYRITNNATSFNMDLTQNIPEALAWFQQLGEIRGNLRDTIKRKVFIAEIFLGHAIDDVLVVQELIRKNVQIRERVSLYFSSRYSSEVEGNQNFVKMKIELKEMINRILNNKINEVAFNNFQIVSF